MLGGIDGHGKKGRASGNNCEARSIKRRNSVAAMNTPSLVELLIVALGFSIVGTYVLCCRRLINASEKETAEQAESSNNQGRSNSGQSTSRFAHA
jgi:hypothetical protein